MPWLMTWNDYYPTWYGKHDTYKLLPYVNDHNASFAFYHIQAKLYRQVSNIKHTSLVN